LFSAPKEPELPLYIEETAKAAKRLHELYTQLAQKNGAGIEALKWGMRGLQASVYAYWAALSKGEPLRVGDREYASPTPKEGLAVVQRVVQELERTLNGEEVAPEPLPDFPDLPDLPSDDPDLLELHNLLKRLDPDPTPTPDGDPDTGP
jgi:hypothetical protein